MGQTRTVTFRHVHSADWLAYFVEAGHPDVRPLAAGVEGAVYELGDGMAAKVWGRRRPDELRLWQAFYADLAAAGLPFATPEILRVEEIRGAAVTVERRLSGTPLQARVDLQARELEPSVAATMLGILRALATVPATPAMRYGAHAAAVTTTLTDAFADHLGHPPQVLHLYRAAYATATSDAFTADGSDGHFDWCTRQLTAAEVTATLGV
jgi:hypothetical protein